ncbi:exocyst complex component SEC15A [Histomonas meleagridis]|uniref:exocyst complex component SEC15A n=1 Tax=Histomonas meleagridis TaxID=135588 RepID=UPI003559E8D4|nr:exocyst complex component SEC15A [Histomonas meleagridis]KAH0800158.1 exocyst complex component SEC15A [Histomonas meleagridis]
MKSQQTQEEQAAAMESRLSTDTDALVSSVLTNENIDKFLEDLRAFIAKKNLDISAMCGEHSLTFSRSIEGAQALGIRANNLQNEVNEISKSINNAIDNYEQQLQSTVKAREDINIIDTKLSGIHECLIFFQLLDNINVLIREKCYYVAIYRLLELSDYDSRISSSSVIQSYLRDIEPIIASIEAEAEKDMISWMTDFRNVCKDIGSSFLYGTEMPKFPNNRVYEYYMVEKQLGKLSSLCELYTQRRFKQLDLIFNIKPPKEYTPKEQIRFLFSHIAGFFYTEYKITSDGFFLIPQSALDDKWKDMINQIKLTIGTLVFPSQTGYDNLIMASQEIQLFAEKMSQCSVSCQGLYDFQNNHSESFRKQMEKQGKAVIYKLIDDNAADFMTVKTPAEFKEIERYEFVEPPTEFPFELPFIPGVPKACEAMEKYINNAMNFYGNTNNNKVVELFCAYVKSCATHIYQIAVKDSSMQNCAMLTSSIMVFPKCIPYFENMIAKRSFSSSKAKRNEIIAHFKKTTDDMIELLNSMFKEFIDQMIDTYSFKMMAKGDPPHNFAIELVMFLESKSLYLKQVLKEERFDGLVQKVVKSIADRIVNVITESHFSWTPQLIDNALQNVSYFGSWSGFIALPSAKRCLNGIQKMFQLLLSNQLVALTSDSNFLTKYRDVPLAAMKVILQNYDPVPYKNLYILSNNLCQNLISQIDKILKRK